MSATTEPRHPCPYCGTMLDEDDCVESDIPAVNGPTLHSASKCREYVYCALQSYKRELAQARAWQDATLPEDDAIAAAHPTRSGQHETYAEAMRLVGARQSKGALVALVNWLLVERDAARALANAAEAETVRRIVGWLRGAPITTGLTHRNCAAAIERGDWKETRT